MMASRPLALIASLTVTLFGGLSIASAQPSDPASPATQPLKPAPLKNVRFTGGFWGPKLETNRTVTLPHNVLLCEETGRIDNFRIAAGMKPGEFRGIFFNDSDVYKVFEGAAYVLAQRPDPALDKQLDDYIALLAAAQRPDGYIYTFYTVRNELDQRYTNLRDKHELYCAGHLIEAAVAHFEATGKRNFLDVAIKLADHIDSVFGPDKRHEVDGHEEIEIALFRLADATGDEKYRKLGEFFVAERGRECGRTKWGVYHQDHMPVTEASEVVGHAVRQMYLLCAATDIAAHNHDASYAGAAERMWDDLVTRKMYVTGGVGAKHEGEAFGEAFELPNESAYAETCAGIGSALFSARMNLLQADAKYFDAVERALYNGFLSGVSLKGDSFFYVNPLASGGKHHRQRWYDCACCPPNVLRFMANLPTLAYATGRDTAYVNLYTTSEATLALGDGRKVQLKQETNYPWDGAVKLTMNTPGEYAVALRLPAWCKQPALRVAGEPVADLSPVNGYAIVRRTWKAGDVVELDLPMPVERVKADPRVKANLGRVALQRGPVVYCAEAVDHGGKVSHLRLPPTAKLSAEHRPDLLGGVTVITSDTGVTAVPYYAWDNRDAGEMAVWIEE